MTRISLQFQLRYIYKIVKEMNSIYFQINSVTGIWWVWSKRILPLQAFLLMLGKKFVCKLQNKEFIYFTDENY